MNLTKSVNIAGVAYIIDEDAFEHLSRYLSDISFRIKLDSERVDILRDVEVRISEILENGRQNGAKIITIEEVKEIVEIIGHPDVFSFETGVVSGGESELKKSCGVENEGNKLMRDLKNKRIGGVCSGIATFFSIDVTFVRIAIFVLIVIYGFGIFFYIVCWIIIPAATSASDLALLEKMKKRYS